MRVGVLGVQVDCLAVLRQGVVLFPLPGENLAKTVVKFGILFLKRHGVTELLLRLGEGAALLELRAVGQVLADQGVDGRRARLALARGGAQRFDESFVSAGLAQFAPVAGRGLKIDSPLIHQFRDAPAGHFTFQEVDNLALAERLGGLGLRPRRARSATPARADRQKQQQGPESFHFLGMLPFASSVNTLAGIIRPEGATIKGSGERGADSRWELKWRIGKHRATVLAD